MRLYMIRHGESETNKNKCYTGWLDVSLTERGMEDAGRAGEVLAPVKFDKVYSSDLRRAMSTAKIALPTYEPETTPLLREVNVGDIAGKPFSTVSDEQRAHIIENGYADIGGESPDEFHKRICAFLTTVENSPYETVAAFAHAGCLREALFTVLGTRLERKHLMCENCTVAIFDFTDGVWRLHSWINLN